jgi:hypothetical protein
MWFFILSIRRASGQILFLRQRRLDTLAYDLSLMWRALVSCRWARVDQIQLVPRLAGFF